MNIDPSSLAGRARIHAALGDPARLAIVDALTLGDASPGEIAHTLDMPTNLVAHHVKVLTDAGLVAKGRSEGDRRRTYLRLRPEALPEVLDDRHDRPPQQGITLGENRLMTIALRRRLLAEFIGTALLVTAVVGSGIMATSLSPADVGLQLLENSTATAFALGALILVFGPVSGAHFNPVVSAADWLLGRRGGTGLTVRDLAGYTVAQVLGAIAGSVLANLMFALTAVDFSHKDRAAGHLWLGEVVATAGLILLIFALARSGRAQVAPAAVGAYIGAAYWFTSSTSFANPAVTIGRAFTDTFAGIAPTSVPGFVLARLVGLTVGVGLLAALYPDAGSAADQVVVPTDEDASIGHRP
ncbi:aquaporin [Micromonospora sp. NPDC048930]|uniref:aquaporin n=1 Tax=Micromonospora sp. NPDC048930 TaxID=3364261 RepID=UPI003720EC4D